MPCSGEFLKVLDGLFLYMFKFWLFISFVSFVYTIIIIIKCILLVFITVSVMHQIYTVLPILLNTCSLFKHSIMTYKISRYAMLTCKHILNIKGHAWPVGRGAASLICTEQFISKNAIKVRSDKPLVLEGTTNSSSNHTEGRQPTMQPTLIARQRTILRSKQCKSFFLV